MYPFWATFFIILRFVHVTDAVPYVTINQGRLFGETINFNEGGTIAKVDVFKGIPYAEPPVRFAAPVPGKPWVGDWNATYYRSACFQGELGFWRPWIVMDVSEDCLYLNVYRPHPSPSSAPVMVYIHGGSYKSGTAMLNDYSGVPMAAFEGVITVVMNYRVNVFGYLSTGDNASPGNVGFLDQAEALKWVRDNINAFGGDSSRVTIFGQSAGAGSVDFHRFSKYSRIFFNQAILESGSATSWWGYRSDPELERTQAFRLGEAVNCSSTDTTSLVECLRDVDTNQLFGAYLEIGYTWSPNLDGVFLDESPYDMLDRGDVKDAPMIVGYSRDEGSLIVPYIYPDYIGKQDPPYVSKEKFDLMTRMSLVLDLGFTNQLMEDSVKQEYMDWSQADNSSFDYFLTYLPIYGDATFSCPANNALRAHVNTLQAPVYQYFLTHVPTTSYYERDGQGTGWFLAGHVEELPFVFGWAFNSDIKDVHFMTEEEKNMSRTIIKMWANFAKNGDPSRTSRQDPPGIGEMEWPQFTIPELNYKELSPHFPVGRGLKSDECSFWGNYLEDLIIMIESMDSLEFQWREEFISWKDDLDRWRQEFVQYQQGIDCPND